MIFTSYPRWSCAGGDGPSMGSSSKSRASPPAPCSIFGLYSALPSRGSQLRRHQCRRLAMSKHYETSCSASPPSASQLLHSLRPLVNVSSPPSASLSSAGCFITALRDQLLPVPHLCSSAEQMLHCSSTAARGSEENGQVSLRRAASRSPFGYSQELGHISSAALALWLTCHHSHPTWCAPHIGHTIGLR